MSSIVENALGPAPDLPINPSDWSYLAEGGFHIILRYDGTDPEIAGRILRIGKKSLGHTHEADGEAGGGDAAVAAAAASAAAATAPDEAGARRKFERGVLMPLLGTHYVQPGDAVTLSRGDIDKIHHSIDHLRPGGRLTKDSGDWSSAAQLEPDKTAFWLKLPAGYKDAGVGKQNAVIAVEIKPKGAVMPVGTLVPPGNNRLKYRVSRFDAQQKFKAQGKQSWGSISRPCLYHPRELYSGEAGRAAATLKELMKTPQNKLRSWENGSMLFGAGSGAAGDVNEAQGGETPGEVKLGKAVKSAGLDGGDGTSAEALMDLVGQILAKEPLVSRLVAAQALDVLEVEGGGLVFDKLVKLCGGSKEEALTMLEDQEADAFIAQPPDADLLLPEEARAALRAGSEIPEGSPALDALYAKALLAVERLTVQGCVQLLRRYIIALGVMDCSVMMSMKAVSREEGAAEAGPSMIQGDDVAGMLETGDGRHVAYCVSVVDAGPKPPTKLSGKAKHEHEIWDFVAGLEDAGGNV